MNSKAWVVARREFLERVRTWWFALVTILGPIGMIAVIVIPAYLGIRTAEKGFTVEILDQTGRDLATAFNIEVELMDIPIVIRSVAPETDETILLKKIADEKIDGYLLLPEDLLERGVATYKGDNATNFALMGSMEQLVSFATFRVKGKDAGLSEAQAAELFKRVEVETLHTTGKSEAKKGSSSFFLGYAVSFIFYISIMIYAVNVLRSVVLEKTNRVVELVISSISPRELMVGKIVGVGAVGILQLTLWGLVGVVLFHFRDSILTLFGLAKAADMIDVPRMGLSTFLISMVYFVLGYFFYAALYAAIGAMVNSEQEAQQAQTPVVMLLIIPVACVQIVASDPRGGIAQILTMIPFSSSILMPMRVVLDAVSPLGLMTSLGVLLLSTAVVTLISAKIYRIGILMHGKKPNFRELWRWIRS